jgi:hypothetical protein
MNFLGGLSHNCNYDTSEWLLFIRPSPSLFRLSKSEGGRRNQINSFSIKKDNNKMHALVTTSQKDIVEISSEPLPTLDSISDLVQDDGAGAITTFSGTTRNVFEGKHR